VTRNPYSPREFSEWYTAEACEVTEKVASCDANDVARWACGDDGRLKCWTPWAPTGRPGANMNTIIETKANPSDLVEASMV